MHGPVFKWHELARIVIVDGSCDTSARRRYN
jgi:hypothetical protein